MPKFQVELDDGKKYMVEADTQPSSEEVIQFINNQQQPDKATEEQYLPIGERAKGGFYPEAELQQRRETQREERGLASGTPLEPTGFNLRNLLDLPGDIADMVGPAFPVIGATVGGALAGAASLPTGPGAVAGVAAGGASGGALGELLRQRIGGAMGIDQGKVIDQLGDIIEQGLYGSLQEVGGVALGKALNATKLGLIKAADKLISQRGMEGFVKGFGSIATHLDGVKTQFALDAVKRGDKRVLSSLFANKNFADNFAKKLFFGEEGNLAKQVYNLSHRTGAKEPIRALYKNFLNIEDDVFDTIFTKGSSVNQYNKPGTLFSLANKVKSGLDDLFDKSGKELGNARTALKERAAGIDVSDFLSQINTGLADDLTNIGFLVKEGDSLFSINPSYAGLRTGSAQAKTFGELVSRFFKTEGDDVLVSAAKKGDVSALQRLANKSAKGRAKIFNTSNEINFGEFIDKLGQIDVQISGREFKQLGALSPKLAEYLKGLRQISLLVEDKVGGSQVKELTRAFSDLAEGASLLRQGTKVKSIPQIENALKRFSNAQPETASFRQAGELNKFLQQNLKVDFIDELRSFKAAQNLKEIESPMGNLSARNKLVSLMKDAFSERNIPIINELSANIDPVLPTALKIADNAKVHTVAEALHTNSASLLRARFLYNILISGALGSMAYGPVGTVGGVGVGLALQNPGILRNLIKASAFMSKQQIKQLLPQGISATTAKAASIAPAGGRLLYELMKKR